VGLVLSVLAGILLWSGFAPLQFPLGPFIGLLVLFKLIVNRSFGQRFFYIAVTGFACFAPLLHWSGSYVGWAPWIALATLQTALFSLLSVFRVERTGRGALLFAAAFTVIELVRMKLPFGGFGWGRIGHTQVDLLSPIYPFVGIAGVSFFVAFFAAWFLAAKFRFLLIVPIFFLGTLMPMPDKLNEIKVAAIQGGVDELGFDYNQRALGVLKRHVTETLAFDSEPELWIWPENASDIDPISNSQAKKLIAEVIADKQTNLLVGAVLRSNQGPQNVSILYNKDGFVSSLYTKQDLAPFGEYMPLRSIAEWVTPEAKRVRDFQAGNKWVLHEISGRRFAAVICFEVLDDDFFAAGANDANFLVAQTNNATFGTSPQALQQLQIIRARAAQFHRDFAVVSTTGFTAHIDAAGNIVEELDQFEPGALEMKISTYEERTIASRINSWFWAGILALVLLWSRHSVFSR
jgi:apolipoprotein N-acyltransferase